MAFWIGLIVPVAMLGVFALGVLAGIHWERGTRDYDEHGH
jgi:uncharacterized membrane protein (DUF4010 family)